MTSCKLPVVLVGLVLLSGCCLPMQLMHNSPSGHHAPAHAAPQPGTGDPNAPQEYIMQEHPPAAPAQPSTQTPK